VTGLDFLGYKQDELYQALEEITTVARKVGWGTADLVQSYYHGNSDGSNLEIQEHQEGPVTAADLAANDYILEELKISLGTTDFGYLSEETYKSLPEESLKSLKNQPWVWIIDPIDGTRDFIDGTGEYAIHIALIHQGKPVVAVVVWPEAQKLYYAFQGGGSFVETREGMTTKLQISQRQPIEELSLLVSRTHRDQRFNQLLAKLPFKTQNYVGSIGCKIATIVEQQADVYLSLSGTSAPKDWDLAAPELILTEAGGQFTHFDGTPLIYNQGDVNQWGGLIACNSQSHEALCSSVSQILREIENGKW